MGPVFGNIVIFIEHMENSMISKKITILLNVNYDKKPGRLYEQGLYDVRRDLREKRGRNAIGYLYPIGK